MIPIMALALLLSLPAISRGGDITLMFPKYEAGQATTDKGAKYTVYGPKREGDRKAYTEVKLADFVKQFEGGRYKVQQMELWIEGRAEDGETTKLFLSPDGRGGCKVTLEPE
jgi:hypothetical protein